jgi:hypothetical protein
MHSRFLHLAAVMVAVVVALVLIPASGAGQTATVEQTQNPPQTPDGQPDIQGFWANQGRRLATYNIQAMEGASDTHTLISGVQSDSHSLIVDPPDGKIPYHPWAQAKRQDVFDNHNNPTKWEHVDPHTLCWLSGIPRMFYQGMVQILQVPGYVVVLQEFNHAYRLIHLDGRPHVPANLKLWMGDSRGRWEGNTLHVDVTNKNDKTRFDIVGDFHSDAVRIRERFIVIDADTIRYEATFDDPTVYTRPFTMRLNLGRAVRGAEAKTHELLEEACREGERSTPLLLRNLRSGPQ